MSYVITDSTNHANNVTVQISNTEKAFRYRLIQGTLAGDWVSYNRIAQLQTPNALILACSEADAGFFLPKAWTPYYVTELVKI